MTPPFDALLSNIELMPQLADRLGIERPRLRPVVIGSVTWTGPAYVDRVVPGLAKRVRAATLTELWAPADLADQADRLNRFYGVPVHIGDTSGTEWITGFAPDVLNRRTCLTCRKQTPAGQLVCAGCVDQVIDKTIPHDRAIAHWSRVLARGCP